MDREQDHGRSDDVDPEGIHRLAFPDQMPPDPEPGQSDSRHCAALPLSQLVHLSGSSIVETICGWTPIFNIKCFQMQM